MLDWGLLKMEIKKWIWKFRQPNMEMGVINSKFISWIYKPKIKIFQNFGCICWLQKRPNLGQKSDFRKMENFYWKLQKLIFINFAKFWPVKIWNRIFSKYFCNFQKQYVLQYFSTRHFDIDFDPKLYFCNFSFNLCFFDFCYFNNDLFKTTMENWPSWIAWHNNN